MEGGGISRFRMRGYPAPEALCRERIMRRMPCGLVVTGCTVGFWLLCTSSASAQQMINRGTTSGGFSGGSGALGSSSFGSGSLGSGSFGSGSFGGSSFGSGALGSSSGSGALGFTGSNFGFGSTSGTSGSTSFRPPVGTNSVGSGVGYAPSYGTTFSGINAFSGISSSNPFGSYYANPLAAGMSSGNTRTRFGSPLYNLATSTGLTGGVGNIGGRGALGGTATISNQQPVGASSIGMRRAPAYTTTLGFAYAPPKVGGLQARLQSVITDSTRLASKDSIQVEVTGDTVILRGTAADEHERRLAEALVRLTPGVRDLQNEIEVRETAPAPRRGP